ncbi:MAG: potassium/hydrogen antiporter [Solirubrobacteraceae bacterium]|nr:potassium/hydrogen antiporter [Solirubrobacteraceae bacterium]
MNRDASLILVAGGLLVAGVGASLVARRIRVPALVLFLAIGMAIGTDGVGWIGFDDYEFARTIGSIALLLILYEGGLGAGFRTIRPVLGPAVSLAIVATIVTAVIAGLAASLVFGFSVKEGLLLGAILSATDGAAVFALLRGSRVPARLARALEGEAGFNDPVAVLLVLVMIKLIGHPGYGAGEAAVFLVEQILVGGVVGVVVGRLAGAGLSWAGRAGGPGGAGGGAPAGLLLVGSLAGAGIAYGAAGVLGGSGFLAVYLAGLSLGDVELAERPALLAFHEGLASVAEIGLFLALGLLVFPSQLGHVALKGVLLALIVALIARPVAAGLATVGSGLSRGERVVLGWAGLRGAIPVVLATFLIIAGVPGSLRFFNVVFFAVLVSAVVQGSTVEPLARRLGVIEA